MSVGSSCLNLVGDLKDIYNTVAVSSMLRNFFIASFPPKLFCNSRDGKKFSFSLVKSTQSFLLALHDLKP